MSSQCSILQKKNTAEKDDASTKAPVLGKLAEDAMALNRSWDPGLALRKWMIPDQYAKYLHVDKKKVIF